MSKLGEGRVRRVVVLPLALARGTFRTPLQQQVPGVPQTSQPETNLSGVEISKVVLKS